MDTSFLGGVLHRPAADTLTGDGWRFGPAGEAFLRGDAPGCRLFTWDSVAVLVRGYARAPGQDGPPVPPYHSFFGNLVGQFICVCRRLRKMRGQDCADFSDRFDQRMAKLLVLKVRSHSLDNRLPELLSAFFVNRLISNHRELVRARRDEN